MPKDPGLSLLADLQSMELGASKAPLELCKIDKVNAQEYTVRAYFFNSRVTRDNVPFCFPYVNLDKGIIFMPEVGSLGVAFWAYRNEPIIVAFLTLSTMLSDGKITRVNPALGNFTLEPLNPGEVMVMGSGRSFIKLDTTGGMFLSTPLFNYFKLDELTHTAVISAENTNYIDEATISVSGIAKDEDGDLIPLASEVELNKYLTLSKERIFDKSDNTINLSIGDIQDTPEILETQRGNVFDIINGEVTQISSGDDIELCYRKQVHENEVALAVSGAAGYITLAAASSGVADYYKDWIVEILNNIPVGIKGHLRTVSAYDGVTKQASVSENWSIVPTNQTIYRISTKRVVIEIDKKGHLFLGDRANDYKGVARIGDTVTVNVGGTDYTGTITSGSINVLASD